MPALKKKLVKNAKKSKISDALGKIKGLESQVSDMIRQMQEKVSQLETLNEVSHLLNSSLDIAVVREKALEATCKLLRCETASLLLVDMKRAELFWETALGESGKQLTQGMRLPIDDRSIAGYVAMTGESVVINDVQSDKRHNKRASTQFVTRTMICVPLMAKDKIIGVLQALNKLPAAPKRQSRHAWPDFYEDDKQILETLSHQVAIAIENSKLYGELKKSFYETVEALAEAIEKKDHYTGGHTKRVVHYSMCIAKYMNLTTDQLEKVKLSALLHDVGKIGVEDHILKKKSSLDEPEWKVMQTHPDIGYDIMSRVEGLRDVIGGMRFHHERWDGKGYPMGLKGEEIPLLARIIAVADTYDAMVSTRPYRKGLDPRVAYDEIVKYRGSQFDPTVVEAFIEAFKNEKMGRGSGGSSLSNCP